MPASIKQMPIPLPTQAIHKLPLSTGFFSSQIPALGLAGQIVLLKDYVKKVYSLYQLGERRKPNCQIQARPLSLT